MTRIIVITGACGFIGSHIVDQLLAQGHSVIGIDNMRTGRKENLSEAMKSDRFRLVNADIRDSNLKSMIKEDVDTIFHLAAISSVKESVENPVFVNDVNVNGTVNVLELARELNAKRFVFISSAAIYGNPEEMPVPEECTFTPLSPYAASKVAGEMYVRSYSSAFGIDSTILRYFNVYGPRQAFSEYSGVISIFINQALADKPITIEGDGSHTRSFVHVSEVAKATILAGEKDSAIGAVVNISGTDLVSIKQIAELMKKVVPSSSSDIVHGPPRVGDVKDSIGSIEKAQKILGFTPIIPLEQGLQETAEWYRTHLGTK